MNRHRVRGLASGLTVAALLAGCAPTGSAATAPDLPGGAAPGWEVSASPATPPAAHPAGTPAPPTCPAAGVMLHLGEVNAAMGLRALGLSLVNCGPSAYRVDGYPAVRALDEQRTPLEVRVLRGVTDITSSLPGRHKTPRPVVLRPGERATAVVVWRNTYTDVTGPPVDVAYLEVAPAPGRPAQILAPEGGLDLGSTGRLGVSPWQATPTPATPQPDGPSTTATQPAETTRPLP